MAFVKTTWVDDADPAVTAAQLNRLEAGIADLYAVSYAEDLTVVTTTGTGGFGDPTTGTVGPEVAFTVPAGGRFVDLAAECQAKHSADNTTGIWFVLRFSNDNGASWAVSPVVGYDNSTEYPDTTSLAVIWGASMWFADTAYRPLRLGFARAVAADATTSFLYPGPTRVWLPVGNWRIRFGYGIKSLGSGTASFKSRRLRAQVLPN